MSGNDPTIFWSYAHFDNAHDSAALEWLCKRLTGELRMQTGQSLTSFFDTESIRLAADWREAISDAIDGVEILVTVVSPSYFRSEFCRFEYELMCKRESKENDATRILPIYYVEAEEIENVEVRVQNPWADDLARRKYFDWRDMRLKTKSSPSVRRAVQHLASSLKVLLLSGYSEPIRSKSEVKDTPIRQPETGTEFADRIDRAFLEQSGTQKNIVCCLYRMHRPETALDDLFSFFRKKVDPEGVQIETSAEFFYRLKDLVNSGLLATRPVGIKTTIVLVLPEVGNVLFDRGRIKT